MNMDKALKNSTQGKVPYIWQIEWLQIDVIKFERMQIHFFSDVFTAIIILVAFKASIGAIQLTKWMQIFFDTGTKFHEFLLRCGIAEESLIYDNLLSNKRITKQHICYMHILWKNTHFKLVQNEGLNKLGWVPA